MYTPIGDLKEKIGERVRVRGWVYRARESGGIAFVIVRDSSGIIQCTFKKGTVPDDVFERASSVTIESSVIVSGTVVEDKRAPGGIEIRGEDIEIVNLAEPFPITKDYSEEFLLDVRHLWIRSRKMTAVMKIRSTVFWALHDFFRKEGYYFVTSPMFITAAVEGGATLFEVNYFGKKAYLTQSAQFYLEALIYSLEKVYTVAPSFRAEKSKTRRHLTEFWHVEAEAAWYHNEDMMKFEERMIKHAVDEVLERNQDELKFLGRDLSKLEITLPFERIKYEEALEILNRKGFDLKWGDDLGADEERALTEEFENPFFITHFPREKGFYHRPDPEEPRALLCHDLLAPEGYGEIIGGGERIYDKNELIERIKEMGLNPEDYDWYIDLRRYGSVPHSGFGLGADRFVMWIAGLEHIRDSTPFPRTITRVKP